MEVCYRKGTIKDFPQVKQLAVKSWAQYKELLTDQNWKKLYNTLTDDHSFTALFNNSDSIICTSPDDTVIGMAFLVPSGNPTEIYDSSWSYIRLVSVDPDWSGKGIGRKLTNICIETAIQNGEQVIALHTSEIMNQARRLYESAGFAVLREIEPRLGKRYWLYTLDLTRINDTENLHLAINT